MDDRDEAGPEIPLVSGTTAATARASGLPARVVPAHVPDHFHAHVSVVTTERVRIVDGESRVVIEQSYAVAWISPDEWVRLVAQVVNAVGGD